MYACAAAAPFVVMVCAFSFQAADAAILSFLFDLMDCIVMLCVMAWRCGGVAAYMRSASFVVDAPESSGSFSWILVICLRQSAKSRLSMGLSVLGIGGWVTSCACRQTRHCVHPHVLQRWQPVVLPLHKQQVRCSAILSNSAEHSVQL